MSYSSVLPRVNWMGSYYVTRIDEEWAKRMLKQTRWQIWRLWMGSTVRVYLTKAAIATASA